MPNKKKQEILEGLRSKYQLQKASVGVDVSMMDALGKALDEYTDWVMEQVVPSGITERKGDGMYRKGYAHGQNECLEQVLESYRELKK